MKAIKYIYILGPAGSGKSTLTASLANTIESHDLTVARVNLDPGAEWIPYEPDVDVRNYIKLSDVMEKYKLGPNGGLVVSVDLMINYINDMVKSIEDMEPDYVLIDTPGQMELFAFRDTGVNIAKILGAKKNSAILFLIDSFSMRKPSIMASMLLLAASTYVKFMFPQVNVLTKIDKISDDDLKQIIEWSQDLTALSDALELEMQESQREISRDILIIVSNLGFLGDMVPVSSFRSETTMALYAELQRIFSSEDEAELKYDDQ
ncbi:MAG: ATP/GTP-binding protein [Thermoprotei archaeon]